MLKTAPSFQIRKSFLRALAIMGILMVFILGYTYWRLQESLAPLDGKLSLSGLEKPVRIIRDAYGIPHLYAENHQDGLRALGFTIASERLFQMELTRRLVYGELSEVFGEPALVSDKLFRSLMIKPSLERMIALEKSEGRFDQKIWNDMEAYFAGVNEFIRTQPRPFELQLIGVHPKPFTPFDAYMMTGYMAFGFAVPMKVTPLLSQLQSTLSTDFLLELRNMKKNGTPLTQQRLQDVKTSVAFWQEIEAFHESLFLPSLEGSNAWLIGPQKSASGKSIFANDPHIGFSNPAVWFEAHLKTPEQEIYGHYMPLIPFPLLGHKKELAWGLTMSLTDDLDYYREVLDHEKQTAIYRGQPVPYRSWTEIIKVKNQADVQLHLIETNHGPVLDAVLDQKGVALSWMFLKPNNNPLKSLYRMGHAKGLKDFEEALKGTTAPGLNVLYADPENIAWWLLGDIPLRSSQNGDFILDGASGKDEYLGFMKWKDKPSQLNPSSGFIVSANSRPPGLDPSIRGDWQSDNRFETIAEKLSLQNPWTVEETKKLQTLNYGVQTPLILNKLLSCLILTEAERTELKKPLELLRTWDHHSTLESKAATLYHLWNNYNLQNLLVDLDEPARELYLGSAYSWIFYERQILDRDCETVVGSSDEHRKSLALKITAGFYSAVQDVNASKKWGQIHTVEYGHPLGRLKPLNWVYNIGPFPAPGAFNEINNFKFKTYGTVFPVGAGPSTRRIVDMAQPEVSWGINPLGVSGHLLSPYRSIEAQKFLNGEYREQIMDANLIEKAKTHELILEPRN